MKKNLLTSFLLIGIICCTIIFMNITNPKEKTIDHQQTTPQPITITNLIPANENKEIAQNQDTSSTIENTTNTDITSMNKSLFIGDSRTVGLMEYSQIDNVDFFCTVGMSVFNVRDDAINVPNIGKVTLLELLDSQDYSRIYIMLGLNELGYPFDTIIEQYKILIESIQHSQPDVNIFLQANLHVTQERSENDDIYNNGSIDRLNTQISTLANDTDVFYIDVNPLFDDENGNLASDKSNDNTHLYAKYYQLWADWITEQVQTLTKEE